MQFGIFTVSDITQDPTTGRTPSEAERIQATLTIAKHAEEVGLDVFALGEHHNPPFWSSSPTTTLAYIAATCCWMSRATAGSSDSVTVSTPSARGVTVRVILVRAANSAWMPCMSAMWASSCMRCRPGMSAGGPVC